MSWLSGIASKAESLLEKVDQSAATALHKDVSHDNSRQAPIGADPYSNKQFDISEIKAAQKPETVTRSSASVHNALPASASGISKPSTSSAKNGLPRTTSLPSVNKNNTEDMLFEFLNNTSNTGGSSRRSSAPRTSTPVKRHATPKPVENPDKPSKNTISLEEHDVTDSQRTKDDKTDEPITLNSETIAPVKVEEKKVEEIEKVETEPLITEPAPKGPMARENTKIPNDRLSNLQLENKLLKSEIASMNDELASALRRAKDLEFDAKRQEERHEHIKQQMAQQEKVMHGYQEHEKDLNEALKAKDSQLAVLRIRIQEVDEENKRIKGQIDSFKSENERILKDHSESTGMQNVALDSLKTKIEELEGQLKKEQEGHSTALNEVMELRNRLQNEQHQMADSVKNLQIRVGEEKSKVKDLEQQLRVSKDNAETAQRDLKEYKDKATRILQAKEKLINSLKQGTAGTDASPLSFTELLEVKQERDMLREELQQGRLRVEQLRSEMLEAEHQHQSESDEQQSEIEQLNNELSEEKSRRQHCEEDLKRYVQEISYMKEDIQRQKTNSMSQLQERDSEIQRLRSQLSLKATISPSQEELENRVHSLTESLIQKQTLVETLGTEKSSLSLQLERLEQQYRDVQQSLNRHVNIPSSENNHFGDIDTDDGSRSPSIASIMPDPITKNRRVKRTVNEIDRFRAIMSRSTAQLNISLRSDSPEEKNMKGKEERTGSIRLGSFFRRYPVARLFLIIYMILLHLWVTVVLLTYKPEIHGHDTVPLPPGAHPPNPQNQIQA